MEHFCRLLKKIFANLNNFVYICGYSKMKTEIFIYF